MKRWNETVFAGAFFILSAFIVLLPLGLSGFILTLDQVVIPKAPSMDPSSARFLYDGIIFILYSLSSWEKVQRILLFAILTLAPFGMFLNLPKKHFVPALISSYLYIFNPFTYTRIMAGQWSLLLGYALFPFMFYALGRYFDKPGILRMLLLGIISVLMISCSLHFSLIFLAVFSVCFAVRVIFQPERRRKLILAVLPAGGLILLLSLHWIIPYISGSSQIRSVLDTFTRADVIIFQSREDPFFGLVYNLMSGYGFWADGYDYIILPKSINPLWWLLSGLVIALSVFGAWARFRQKKDPVVPVTLLIIFFLALDFAGGIALRPFTGVMFALYDKIPFLIGFREPQKLVGLIFFAYAYFSAFGLGRISERFKSRANIGIALLGLAVIAGMTPTFFGSFWGQLKPSYYPSSWEKANAMIKNDRDDFLTVFFPWHQYMRMSLAHGRIIANPAERYFDRPILSARNYETVPLYSHDERIEAKHIHGLLTIEKEGKNLQGEDTRMQVTWGEGLSAIDAKYVILSKDSDWMSYAFLDTDPDLDLMFESENLKMYENRAFVSSGRQDDDWNQDISVGMPTLTPEVIPSEIQVGEMPEVAPISPTPKPDTGEMERSGQMIPEYFIRQAWEEEARKK